MPVQVPPEPEGSSSATDAPASFRTERWTASAGTESPSVAVSVTGLPGRTSAGAAVTASCRVVWSPSTIRTVAAAAAFEFTTWIEPEPGCGMVAVKTSSAPRSWSGAKVVRP